RTGARHDGAGACRAGRGNRRRPGPRVRCVPGLSGIDLRDGRHGHAGARGLERITRHPFFVGVAIAAAAHALLATRLVGTVFSLRLRGRSLVGAWHQDRKLLARRGRPFADFLAVTSVVPFAAILSGRQRLVARELPWGTLVVTLLVVGGLRAVHESIFASG